MTAEKYSPTLERRRVRTKEIDWNIYSMIIAQKATRVNDERAKT